MNGLKLTTLVVRVHSTANLRAICWLTIFLLATAQQIACSPGTMATSTPASAPIPTNSTNPVATVAVMPTATPASAPTAASTPEPEPAPTSTPRPTLTPTPIATPGRLEEKECENCQLDYEPVFSLVDWVQKPQVSGVGRFSFIATIDEGYGLIIPGQNGGAANVVFSVGSSLYGTILPPSEPGWSWNPSPNQWIADTYEYQDRTLTVVAQVAPAVATHPGLKLCLWIGGNEAEVLDCVDLD